MLEVAGKYNTAKIFTDVVDQASISQIIGLCNQEFTAGSRIRLMPDIYAGVSCTVGTTMTITILNTDCIYSLCVNFHTKKPIIPI